MFTCLRSINAIVGRPANIRCAVESETILESTSFVQATPSVRSHSRSATPSNRRRTNSGSSFRRCFRGVTMTAASLLRHNGSATIGDLSSA